MGHDFGRFFEVWKFFKNNSKTRPSLEHWAKKNSRKNYPKTCSKHVWSLLGTILIIFGILQFFWKHFEDSTLLGTLGKKLFQKNYPKTCSKHVSTNWERVWAFFQFWKIFKNISKTGPSLEHQAKKLFEKFPKTRSKYFWTIWERFWAFLEFCKFFENISKTRPSLEHWAKNFFKKITPKHVQNTFGQIGNDFGRFFKFANFLKTFRRLDTPWNTGQMNFQKNYPKTCSKHVWTNGSRFWAFFWSLKIF